MTLFSKYPHGVMKSEGWKCVQKSTRLLEELLGHGSCQEAHLHACNASTKRKIEDLDVSSLRTWLDTEGLDVDGSRENLVKRFKVATGEEICEHADKSS